MLVRKGQTAPTVPIPTVTTSGPAALTRQPPKTLTTTRASGYPIGKTTPKRESGPATPVQLPGQDIPPHAAAAPHCSAPCPFLIFPTSKYGKSHGSVFIPLPSLPQLSWWFHSLIILKIIYKQRTLKFIPRAWTSFTHFRSLFKYPLLHEVFPSHPT